MAHAGFETFNISVAEEEPDFNLARSRAEALAATRLNEPMLIAWFDGRRGEEHPHVPECQHQPGWLAYAEGHGGRVRVDINGDEYSFIFTDASID